MLCQCFVCFCLVWQVLSSLGFILYQSTELESQILLYFLNGHPKISTPCNKAMGIKADDSMNLMNVEQTWCTQKIRQYGRGQANIVSRTGLAIVWCHCDVINNSEILENADIKLLTESQAKLQSDKDYFRCPVVARGPPIIYTDRFSRVLPMSNA